MKKQRIAEAWEVFRDLVLPLDAPPIQLREMRRSFYAGAQSFLDILMRDASTEEEITDEDMGLMVELTNELVEFGERVQKGEA